MRCKAFLLAVLFSALLSAGQGRAQVFVVGVKTATADVTTEFHPTHVELPAGKLDERGRLELLRDLESEQGFAHRELPFGPGLLLVANGNMEPGGEEYKKMLYQKGQSAAPGDRLMVTKLDIKPDALIIDFNGGPYAKHRFLSHLSINDMPLAQLGPVATGCRVILVFEGGVPQVTAAEVKALLDPLVDFHAKNSEEAYADTLSPQVREAVEQHEVLVGMNRRMVLAAVGEPKTKHREHAEEENANSPVYEEWIYGEPPKATEFVRFQDGKVVRREVAELGKPIQIFDKDELNGEIAPTLRTHTIANGDVQKGDEMAESARKAPSLRRAGEPVDPYTVQGGAGMGKVADPSAGRSKSTGSSSTAADPSKELASTAGSR